MAKLIFRCNTCKCHFDNPVTVVFKDDDTGEEVEWLVCPRCDSGNWDEIGAVDDLVL